MSEKLLQELNELAEKAANYVENGDNESAKACLYELKNKLPKPIGSGSNGPKP